MRGVTSLRSQYRSSLDRVYIQNPAGTRKRIRVIKPGKNWDKFVVLLCGALTVDSGFGLVRGSSNYCGRFIRCGPGNKVSVLFFLKVEFVFLAVFKNVVKTKLN